MFSNQYCKTLADLLISIFDYISICFEIDLPYCYTIMYNIFIALKY